MQLLVDDATIEAVTDALADNSRGILWHRDELAGLLLDMDKYSGEKGSTKARLLSAYDSDRWKVNRASGKNVLIEHATLSLFGTIQPGIMVKLFDKQDQLSGFLPRVTFVLVRPQGPQLWNESETDTAIEEVLDPVVEKLLSLDFDSEAKPMLISMSQEAKDAYVPWHSRQARLQYFGSEEDEALAPKLRSQALRLVLILHLLDWAVGQDQDQDHSQVPKNTMGKALALADWLRDHQHQAWRMILDKDTGQISHKELVAAKAILSLIPKAQSGKLTVAEITEEANQRIAPGADMAARTVGQSL